MGLPQLSSDLLNEQAGGRLLYYDVNTKNTPYTAGLTGATEGAAITVGRWDSHITCLAIPKGDNKIYLYSKYPNETHEWHSIV